MARFHLPYATVSRYMQTTDWDASRARGCNDGENVPEGEDVVVILDYGQPWFDGNEYGTIVFGTYDFRSMAQVEEGAKGYITGFFECMGRNAYLTLAVGVNNYGREVTREHGAAWAAMINDLNTWVATPPSYAGSVTVRGASDIEPSFNGPLVTRAWVDGYNAAMLSPSFYYDFGSCDSCPFTDCPSCDPANDWELEDIWYVSYGATAALPLPEIYLQSGVNAEQWQRMSLYSSTVHGQAMMMRGSLTQWRACQGKECYGVDNRPDQGWSQLTAALNADPRTAVPVSWATDMTWESQ